MPNVATHLITDINVEKELEVSFVPHGSNPLSKVILKKAAVDPSQPEKTDMLKSVAIAGLMGHLTTAAFAKNFAKEEDLDAFLAKDDAGQKADVVAFAKANKLEDPYAEKVKKADAGDDTKSGVEKAADTISGGAGDDAIAAAVAKAFETSPILKSLQEENASLKKQLGDISVDSTKATLEKRATTEFAGLDLQKMVSVLTSLQKIAPEERTEIETLLKAYAELKKTIAPGLGLRKLHDDATSATALLRKAAAEYAVVEKIGFDEAFSKVCEMPQHAELVEKVDAEEREALAA